MKHLMLFFLIVPMFISAQTPPSGILAGQVSDGAGEALIGVSVKLMRGDTFVRGVVTDLEGKFRVKLPAGLYNLECSYSGFTTFCDKNVDCLENMENWLDIVMSAGNLIYCSQVYWCPIPMIKTDPGNSGATYTAGQLRNMF